MPRLLIATTVPETLQAFLVPLARHFRARGWRVDARSGGPVAPRTGAEFDEVFEVPWSRNPLALRNLVEAPRAVRRIVETRRHDVVHVHTPIAGFALRLALRPGRIADRPAVVYTAHGFHFHERGGRLSNSVFLGMERLAGRWTDRLVVINKGDERAALRYGIVSPDRLRYIPGIGVDLAEYDPGKVSRAQVSRVRDELGIPEGENYFLMVAEFNPGKRHADMIRALAMTGGREHLVCAGTGPLLERTRSLSRELGLDARVKLLGFRSDIPVLMRGATAVVLPSEREGLPRSILEAMALEVPVIATKIRGCTDLIGGGRGWLVEVGDVDGLARALRNVTEEPGVAIDAVRRAREHVKSFALEEVIRHHESLYASVLRERSA
jgi:glycosyltransferase involved in cell wall biosynthesis